MTSAKMLRIAHWMRSESISGVWCTTFGGNLALSINGQLDLKQHKRFRKMGFITLDLETYIYAPNGILDNRKKLSK